MSGDLHAEVLAAVRQVREEMIVVRKELGINHKAVSDSVTSLRTEMNSNHQVMGDGLNHHIKEESVEVETIKVAIESMTRLMMEIQKTNSDNSKISADTVLQLGKIADTLKNLEEKTINIEGAFPNKDLVKHHDEHLTKQQKADRWNARIEKWKDDLGGWLVKIVLVFIAVAVWEAFKVNLK